jgi:UDP-N-acetylmuramate dehydrogenase
MTALSELTTLRVGGTPRSLIFATSEKEIVDAVAQADAENRSLLILGGGSNVVISDDFAGDVLVIANKGIENDSTVCAGAWVTVQAGERLDDFVAQAVTSGWVGIETLSGIPGTVGASPLQNVGAYGQQVSDTIAQVRAYNRITKQIDTLFTANCEFGYRTSVFKLNSDKWVVLSVTFQLALGDLSGPIAYQELADDLGVELGKRAPLVQTRDAVVKLRKQKGMVVSDDDLDSWSAGSFFVNPFVTEAPVGAPTYVSAGGGTKVSAAWLIEHAGFPKGFGLNDRVTLSTKHALAITNRGSGTSADVMELAGHIQAGVLATFGLALEIEPQIIR